MKKSQPPKAHEGQEQKEQEVLTKEDFLKTLKKVTRRVPKASRGTGKKRTSG